MNFLILLVRFVFDPSYTAEFKLKPSLNKVGQICLFAVQLQNARAVLKQFFFVFQRRLYTVLKNN